MLEPPPSSLHSVMMRRTLWSMALPLVVLAACDTSIGVVTYPCKHPEATHMGPDGKPDPCHFEDPGSPAAAVTTFFESAAPAFCEAFFACCQNPSLLHALGGASVDECKTLWSHGEGLGTPTLTSLKAALVNGETSFDPAKLDACVARLTALAAGGDACIEPAAFVFFNSCMAAFDAQLAPGAACTWGESNIEDLSFTECKDGRCFDGKCEPFLKTDDACSIGVYITDPPSAICNYVRGEGCMGIDGSGKCGPQVEVGAPCLTMYGNYQCKSLTCADGSSPTACIAPSADDTACVIY